MPPTVLTNFSTISSAVCADADAAASATTASDSISLRILSLLGMLLRKWNSKRANPRPGLRAWHNARRGGFESRELWRGAPGRPQDYFRFVTPNGRLVTALAG